MSAAPKVAGSIGSTVCSSTGGFLPSSGFSGVVPPEMKGKLQEERRMADANIKQIKEIILLDFFIINSTKFKLNDINDLP
jgi:hypothetical protein